MCAEVGCLRFGIGIGTDSHDQKDVTRGPPDAGAALTLDADSLTGCYPGGNRDLNGARLRKSYRCRCTRAYGAADESLAMADRTGIGRLDVKPSLGAAEGFVEGDFDRLLNVLTAGR